MHDPRPELNEARLTKYEIDPEAKITLIYRQHSILVRYADLIKKVVTEQGLPINHIGFRPGERVKNIQRWLTHHPDLGQYFIADGTVKRSHGLDESAPKLNLDSAINNAVARVLTKGSESSQSIGLHREAFVRIMKHIEQKDKTQLPNKITVILNKKLLEHPPFFLMALQALKQQPKKVLLSDIPESHPMIQTLLKNVKTELFSWFVAAGLKKSNITFLQEPSDQNLEDNLKAEQWLIVDAHMTRDQSNEAQQFKTCLTNTNGEIEAKVMHLPLIELAADAEKHELFSFTPEEETQIESYLKDDILEWLSDIKMIKRLEK